MIYEVETNKKPEEIVSVFEEKAKEKGFGTLHSYNVHKLLEEKGHPIEEEVYIFEICNPGYAKQALTKESKVACFLPCRIAIYTKGGKTIISTMEPSAMPQVLGESISDIANEVDKLIKDIVQELTK